MKEESDLGRLTERELKAAQDLQKALESYQANRTPDTRAEYLRALNEFSKVATDR